MKKLLSFLFFILGFRMIELGRFGQFSIKYIDVLTIGIGIILSIILIIKKIPLRINTLDVSILIYIVYSCVSILVARDKLSAISDIYRLIVSVIAFFNVKIIFDAYYIKSYFPLYISSCKAWIKASIISIFYSTTIFLLYGVHEIKSYGVYAINSFKVRFSGFSADPNLYSMYLIMSLIILVEMYKIKEIGKRKFKVCFFMISMSIILTFSRSGILILILYFIFFIDKKYFRLKLKICIYITIGLSILLIINPFNFKYFLYTRIFNAVSLNVSNDYAIYTRFLFYKIAFTEFSSSPIWGVGRGNYISEAKKYFCNVPKDLNPQGVPYQIISELGIIGMCLFLAICFIAISYLIRLKRITLNKRYRSILNINYRLIMVFLLSSFFGNFDTTRELWYILAMISSSVRYFYCCSNNKMVKKI